MSGEGCSSEAVVHASALPVNQQLSGLCALHWQCYYGLLVPCVPGAPRWVCSLAEPFKLSTPCASHQSRGVV